MANSRYRCPSCPGSPLPPRREPGGVARCARCGAPLPRRKPRWRGPALAIGVAFLGVGLASIPDLLQGRVSVAVRSPVIPPLLDRLEPQLKPEELPTGLLNGELFAALRAADREWLPVKEPLPGGGVRYLYKRRPGDPELSIPEIQQLMNNPPSHGMEQEAIIELLRTMEAANVRLHLSDPKKSGAAGEWDHGRRTMRIDPAVVNKGTVEFAEVLNHEAIHVAQSCSGGSLWARPQPLGISTDLRPEVAVHLDDPLYADVSPEERTLEKEAYANQHVIGMGASLIRSHCRLKSEELPS